MAAVKSLVFLAAGAIIGAGAVTAYRISQETGRPLQEVLSEVPAELEHLYADLRRKGTEALHKGRDLYEEKQEELVGQFKEFSSAKQQ